jgi:GlpG protein
VWEVGRRIEFAHGVPWFLGVTFAASIAANGLQAWLAPLQLFGGMSGVVFAYLGYVMVWDWFRPALKIGLAKGVYIVMIAYLVLGFSGLIDLLGLGSLANGAHLGGLLAGMVLASVRAMWRPDSVAPGQ